jgi:hypothetical protein
MRATFKARVSFNVIIAGYPKYRFDVVGDN